jgi:hypothetical protein
MDPITCEPSGVINRVKEKIDPLGFWVDMTINADMALKVLTEGDLEVVEGNAQDCRILYSRNPKKLEQCLWRVENTISFWRKCKAYAEEKIRRVRR